VEAPRLLKAFIGGGLKILKRECFLGRMGAGHEREPLVPVVSGASSKKMQSTAHPCCYPSRGSYTRPFPNPFPEASIRHQ
jgi:hypothetical protein